jgi:hypothetical protein
LDLNPANLHSQATLLAAAAAVVALRSFDAPVPRLKGLRRYGGDCLLGRDGRDVRHGDATAPKGKGQRRHWWGELCRVRHEDAMQTTSVRAPHWLAVVGADQFGVPFGVGLVRVLCAAVVVRYRSQTGS